MRLILEYSISDGYTYFCQTSYPVVYESAEALLVDLMDEALAALRENRDMQKVAGLRLQSRHFYEPAEFGETQSESTLPWVEVETQRYLAVAPNIFTVDEWFASRGRDLSAET